MSLPTRDSSVEYKNSFQEYNTSSKSNKSKENLGMTKPHKKSFLPTFFRKKTSSQKLSKQENNKSKISEYAENKNPSHPPPKNFQNSYLSLNSEMKYRNCKPFVADSEKSSSSSSSSSSKSSRSATSQDSVRTVISNKCS